MEGSVKVEGNPKSYRKTAKIIQLWKVFQM